MHVLYKKYKKFDSKSKKCIILDKNEGIKYYFFMTLIMNLYQKNIEFFECKDSKKLKKYIEVLINKYYQ